MLQKPQEINTTLLWQLKEEELIFHQETFTQSPLPGHNGARDGHQAFTQLLQPGVLPTSLSLEH